MDENLIDEVVYKQWVSVETLRLGLQVDVALMEPLVSHI